MQTHESQDTIIEGIINIRLLYLKYTGYSKITKYQPCLCHLNLLFSTMCIFKELQTLLITTILIIKTISVNLYLNNIRIQSILIQYFNSYLFSIQNIRKYYSHIGNQILLSFSFNILSTYSSF